MAKKNAPPRKSSTPLILTIAAAVVTVGVLIAVSMSGGAQQKAADGTKAGGTELATVGGTERTALGATRANAKVTLVEYGDFL